jgi:hypothetical protein
MEVDVSSLINSKDKFTFLFDRQQKIGLLKEKLDNSIYDLFTPDKQYIQEANAFLALLEIYMESILLYSNSQIDILIDIIETETSLKIVKKGKNIYNPEYQKELFSQNKILALFIDYINSYESKFIRNASNMIKHEKLIKATLTIGSEESGVFLKPFSTNGFTINTPTSHTNLFNMYTILIRKSICIFQEIIDQKKAI